MSRRTLPMLLLITLCCVQSAAGGECRNRLRPLLLAAEPDPRVLLEVRAGCRREADAGDPDAGYQLALMQLGLLDWTPEAAIPAIRDAAAAGVPEAQYWLAWQYESGPLLPNDAAQALYWYRAAAEQDHRLALGRLADAHATGELGLRRDPGMERRFRARIAQCAVEAG